MDDIPPLIQNGQPINDPNDKANVFNQYFQSQTELDDSNIPVPELQQSNFSLSSVELNTEEVQSTLKSLVTGKACGPDQINNRILKELAVELAPVLTDLFNTSLLHCTVPDIWKKANVSPVHKKDDKSSVDNYRPISLLSSVGKTMEKLIHKHVHNYLLQNNIITCFQSGFTAGDSSVNQLVELYNTFCQALDEGKEVRAVFCDISKAFDRVWHRGLFAKLKHYGICVPLLNWFISYLTNRFQRVVIPGGVSGWLEILAGVPQGSILGPLLFIIFINDIVKEIHSNIRLFADDTSLYIVVDFPDSAAQILNLDLERLYNWAVQWLVKFNPIKTESLLFSRRVNLQDHPTLFFNDVPIQEVVSHKHLGVYLSQRCDWQKHIDFIKEKAWSRINLLRMLKFTINRKSLETIYFAYIRSLLEYADVLWDNCTQQQCNEIEKIQLEAGRIVTGATKLVEIDKLYKELGWLKLSERRDLHKLFLFFKMNHGLSPLYLSNLLPLHVGELSSYRLRNAENYVGIHANTRAYAESFLPSTIQAWNNLPEAVRSADTLGAFKHLLTLDTTKVPAYYDCGDRLDQISHTRLRTECSSLNQHLFRRNLVQNPYCLCGEIEDNKHFLLTCPRHTQMRAEMVLSIQQKTNVELTTDVLLFGTDAVSVEVNTFIFKAVQKYIKLSKRFSQ